MQLDNQLRGYLDDDGLLTRLPGKKQKKKLDLLIDFLASQFESDTTYTEIEVNTILNQHHSFNDPATLRRLLIGTKKLQRSVDGREYWKTIDS
jgi:hypothetical protein